jgi:hypothetical protein
VRLLVAVVLLAALVGCTPARSPVHTVVVTCAGYASTLESLAVRRQAGLLDEDTIARVDQLRAIGTPICTAENPPDGSALTIDAILRELEVILARTAAGERA